MTKNRGGKKFKRKKKISNTTQIIYKDSSNEGQLYGVITEILGDCRYKVFCEDGTNRLGSLRGKLRKRVRIENNDIIIICPREFQDNKGDIIHIYNNIDARILKNDENLKKFLEYKKKISQKNNEINSNYDDNVLFTIDDTEDKLNTLSLDSL